MNIENIKQIVKSEVIKGNTKYSIKSDAEKDEKEQN